MSDIYVGKPPFSLSSFIDGVPSSEKTLLVVNRTDPDPFINLLDKSFTNQSVTVAERHIPEGYDDLVCLIDDGEVIATSPCEQLQDSFLMINTDHYRTGANPIGSDTVPDVLIGLAETEFSVAGYPASNKEKLLLVMMSRFIEQLALATGAGRLDSTFQQLSRLDDEYGTKTMYEWRGESNVETHVYGVRDDPTVITDMTIQVHSDDTEAYRRSWVVAFSPDEPNPEVETDHTHAALVAVEVGPNVWRGVWTYDNDRVDQIQSYIKRNF